MNETPVLSCSVLALRAMDKRITTLEGLQPQAEEFGAFMHKKARISAVFAIPDLS